MSEPITLREFHAALTHIWEQNTRRCQVQDLKDLFRDYRSFAKPTATWANTTVEELVDWAETHR